VGGQATLHTQPDIGIVDSGATALYLPTEIGDAWYASFPTPPPTDDFNDYYWPCDGKLPPLGIQIAGKVFTMDPRDLIAPYGDGGYKNATDGLDYCWVPVLVGQAPFPFVLGDVFQQSVVGVYDWGNHSISFAHYDY
jgi:hypothetical protein